MKLKTLNPSRAPKEAYKYSVQLALLCNRQLLGGQEGQARNKLAQLHLYQVAFALRKCKVDRKVLLSERYSVCVQACSDVTYAFEAPEVHYDRPDSTFRSDVREDEAGVPVEFFVTVIGPDCDPVAGAFVDLWQANANGVYSGFSGMLLATRLAQCHVDVKSINIYLSLSSISASRPCT